MNPSAKRIGAYLGITLLTYPVIFGLSMLFIVLLGSRIPGMSLGAMIGVGIAWLLFPFLFWRPFNFKTVFQITAVFALSYACLSWADSLNLRLAGGPYGLYDFILFFSLPCAALFELATHIRRPKPSAQPNA